MLIGLSAAAIAQPTINSGQIVNVSGNTPKLAPGTVFAVYGQKLGPDTIVIATAPNYPDTLAGTSVTFTPVIGGSAIVPKLVYSLNIAVAGVLPSTIAPGTYAVRVTYNGQTSAPQSVVVVARAFNIATANGIGTGVAQATDAQVNLGYSLTRLTSAPAPPGIGTFALTPAHPGETISLWGTGGGADLANDTGGSSGDQTVAGNFKIILSSRTLTPLYAGAVAGYPGLWVVIFTVPVDADADCYASLQVSSNGELSNLVVLPIAATGQTFCADHQGSEATLAKMDAGKDIFVGVFGIAKLTATDVSVTNETASGFFGRYTSTQWLLTRIGYRFGGCTVNDRTYQVPGGKEPGAPDVSLDAGTSLLFTGPNVAGGVGLGSLTTPMGPVYAYSASPGGVLTSGTYTLRGTGGTQVGAFNVSTKFPTIFTVTNWDAVTSVNRTKPLTFNWTGTGVDQVYIQVNSVTVSGTTRHIVTLNCYVPAAPGTYTIAPEVLAYLPPVAASGQSFGSIAVEGFPAENLFTAPLVGGGQIDVGVFQANFGVTKNVAIQ